LLKYGETHLEEVSVLCSDTAKTERVPASSMFIFIGALPRQTGWAMLWSATTEALF
jgi:hypothetical protein